MSSIKNIYPEFKCSSTHKAIMKRIEMEAIIQPLVKDFDDNEKAEIIDALEKLFGVVEISRTFQNVKTI